MKKIVLSRFIFMLSCSAFLFSCKKENLTDNLTASGSTAVNLKKADLKEKLLYGAPVKMGNGVLRSWILIGSTGKPQEIGIEMTRNSVDNIPEGHEEAQFSLPLPQEAKDLTAFEHLVVNWNVHGHAPFFYQYPHFDFHFYTITEAERLAIPSYAESPAGFDNNPAPGYLPPVYIAPPGGEESEMGKHWVDATAPELPQNGGALFTKTFIYGSYNGKVNFYEPMVTLAYLKSGVSSSGAYPQPALFAEHTYYPTKFNIYRTDGNQKYNVSLSDFVLR